MSSYWQIFRYRPAQLLLLSAFPGRFAYGMISLAIYFKVHQDTSSIGIAGLAVGLNGLAGALTAGIRSAVIDKFGLLIPLRILVPSYALLIITFNHMHGATPLVIVSFIMGFTAPPINLAVRPIWKVTVPQEWYRATFAVDTAMMSVTAVIGPVVATSLALSSHPSFGLNAAASLMVISGISISLLSMTKKWRPEEKIKGGPSLLSSPAIRLLMLEGAFVGLGTGTFEIAIPAFATLKNVQGHTGPIFAALAIFNVIGSLIGGLLSKKFSPLAAFRLTYFSWFVASLPLALLNPDWTLMIGASFLGLAIGAQQVFYWEITEAVRPQGSAASAIGWLWTVEGSCAAFGTTLGGYISQHFSPRWSLLMTTTSIGIGLIVILWGSKFLHAANHIPSDEQDIRALDDKTSTES